MQRSGQPWVGAVSLLLALLCASPAAAVVIGDFEGSFDGWSTSGSVATVTDAFGILPTLNAELLQLRTQGGTVSDATLDSFFGFSAGTIDALSPSGNPATEGSAVSFVLTANAGDEIVFDYNFLSRETDARKASYDDFAFLTVRSNEQGEIVLDQAASMIQLPTSSARWSQTGWQQGRYTFQTSGTFTIGFGVVDVLDSRSESRLLLDDLLHIPEPSTGVLSSLGVLGLAIRARHRRR